MPKSRKKKNRDFQKVKLKAGKERRQANETVLSFKTRTIKVTQALHQSSTSTHLPQTKKRLTFEEVLKRCDANKTVSQRLSGLEGLQELLLAWEGEVTPPHFSAIMSRVGVLFFDPEPPVRQAVVKLCGQLFSSVSEASVDLRLFSAQLCCAVGHVSDAIRRDAMVIFDLLLDKCPDKLVAQCCRLVPTLLAHVTAAQGPGQRSGVTAAPSRCGRTVTRLQRAELLQRLTRVVDAYVSNRRRVLSPDTQGLGVISPAVQDQSRVVSPASQEALVCGVGRYPVVRSPCVPPSWAALWTQRPRHREESELQEFAHLATDAGQLEALVRSLLPVVSECWTDEFSAEDTIGHSYSASRAGGQLTEASVPMVQGVVGLLHSLVQCWRCCDPFPSFNKGCWFRTGFLQSLREMFLPHFPITVVERPRKNKKGQEVTKGPEEGKKGQKPKKGQKVKKGQEATEDASPIQLVVLKLNLVVCELLASFPPPVKAGEEELWPMGWVDPEDWQAEVATFLLRNFQRCVQDGLTSNLGDVLRLVFLNYPCSDKVAKLLQKTQKRFIKAPTLSPEKSILLDLLDGLAFDVHRRSPYHATNTLDRDTHTMLTPYLNYLPQLLLQLCRVGGGEGRDVGPMVQRVCRALSHRGSTVLTQSVTSHITHILDPHTGVFSSLPQRYHDSLVLAVCAALYNRPVSEPGLRQIGHILRLPCVSSTTAHRLLASVTARYREFLAQRRTYDAKLHTQVEDSRMAYLSFLFSALLGHTAEELSAMDTAWEGQDTGGLTAIVWSPSLQQLTKHRDVWNSMLQYFNDFLRTSRPEMSEYGVFTLDTMSDVWNDKILGKYRALSMVTAWSALIHWRFMVCQSHLTQGDDLHLEGVSWAQPEEYGRRLEQFLPVMQSRVRPFSRLAFSLMQAIVGLQTQEGGRPEEGVVEVVWRAVVEAVGLSVSFLQDLITVATDFVNDVKSEEEVRKATQALGKLLAESDILELRASCGGRLTPTLNAFQTAVQANTAGADRCEWWDNFVTACAPYLACG